jgi:hypothetical protein
MAYERKFEFATDPHTLAEMSADTVPGPCEILERMEEEEEVTGIHLTVEEVLDAQTGTKTMSKNDTNTTPEAKADEKPLGFLNDRPANCLGLLHMTPSLHAHLQNEAERLRRGQVSNLWWIAAFYGEYGVQPTIEDVFHTAPAIAEDLDSFIFDRQQMPDGYQDDTGRTGRTTNQYKSIEQNALRLLENQGAIDTLKSAGYTADHLTARELYDALAETARKRDLDRKIREENAQKVKEMKLKQVAVTAGGRYGFEI